jgi:hypothetical protein
MSALQPAHAHSANNPISQNLLSIFLLLTCFLFRQQPCPIFPLRATGDTPTLCETISDAPLNVNRLELLTPPIIPPEVAENLAFFGLIGGTKAVR